MKKVLTLDYNGLFAEFIGIIYCEFEHTTANKMYEYDAMLLVMRPNLVVCNEDGMTEDNIVYAIRKAQEVESSFLLITNNEDTEEIQNKYEGKGVKVLLKPAKLTDLTEAMYKLIYGIEGLQY